MANPYTQWIKNRLKNTQKRGEATHDAYTRGHRGPVVVGKALPAKKAAIEKASLKAALKSGLTRKEKKILEMQLEKDPSREHKLNTATNRLFEARKIIYGMETMTDAKALDRFQKSWFVKVRGDVPFKMKYEEATKKKEEGKAAKASGGGSYSGGDGSDIGALVKFLAILVILVFIIGLIMSIF